MEGAHIRPFKRGIGDAPGGACQGVPVGGARARETLPWLDCQSSWIRASKRLALFVKRWARRAASKATGGEFMVEREDENDILTDDDEDAV